MKQYIYSIPCPWEGENDEEGIHYLLYVHTSSKDVAKAEEALYEGNLVKITSSDWITPGEYIEAYFDEPGCSPMTWEVKPLEA